MTNITNTTNIIATMQVAITISIIFASFGCSFVCVCFANQGGLLAFPSVF